jgi:hypothetical protein
MLHPDDTAMAPPSDILPAPALRLADPPTAPPDPDVNVKTPPSLDVEPPADNDVDVDPPLAAFAVVS